MVPGSGVVTLGGVVALLHLKCGASVPVFAHMVTSQLPGLSREQRHTILLRCAVDNSTVNSRVRFGSPFTSHATPHHTPHRTNRHVCCLFVVVVHFTHCRPHKFRVSFLFRHLRRRCCCCCAHASLCLCACVPVCPWQAVDGSTRRSGWAERCGAAVHGLARCGCLSPPHRVPAVARSCAGGG